MPRGKNKRPRSERRKEQHARDEKEQFDMEMLDDVGCPRTTAARIVVDCEDAFASSVAQLLFLNVADAVWADRPEHAQLHAAVIRLKGLLETFGDGVGEILRELTPLTEAYPEHQDLNPEEIAARLDAARDAEEASEL